jgi:hypothetical protein
MARNKKTAIVELANPENAIMNREELALLVDAIEEGTDLAPVAPVAAPDGMVYMVANDPTTGRVFTKMVSASKVCAWAWVGDGPDGRYCLGFTNDHKHAIRHMNKINSGWVNPITGKTASNSSDVVVVDVSVSAAVPQDATVRTRISRAWHYAESDERAAILAVKAAAIAARQVAKAARAAGD